MQNKASTPPWDVVFHNLHPERRENGSWQLCRFPLSTRHELNERGRMTSMCSCGGEIRFVTEAKNIRITVSCDDSDDEVQIYRGAFLHATYPLNQGVPVAILISPPERMQEATDEALSSGGFSPNVWRICFGRGSVLLHHLETFGHTIRPPLESEIPSHRWLAYGSSITHSSLLGYPLFASRFLHWNVWNKGLSGSCHIDKSAVDYLARLIIEENISIVTAELGVNMRGEYTQAEFSKRARYLVKTLREANKNIPIILINIFTNSHHYPRNESSPGVIRQREFDDALRALKAESDDDKLYLIEGTDILTDFSLLSADVLHPTPSGHALMGINLANHLRKITSTTTSK